jgi:thioredoxin reductase (NADPH)
MDLPVLLAVEPDRDTLEAVERELSERYGRHYRVICLPSATEAAACLDDLARSGVDVALVLAGQSLDGSCGTELLARVRRFHPHARRALLIEWGDWGQNPTGEAIFDGISHGYLDHYVLRPTTSPDEMFHHSVSGLLLEWAQAHRTSPGTVHVVGSSWSGRAYELREALQQCAIPHNFCLVDSDEGRRLLATAGDDAASGELPLMIMPNGHVLVNPSNAEIAVATGAPVDPDGLEFDLVVVGAGPAGLSAAVYGASEGLSTLVIDRGGIGGQATSSSLIRNYLGFSRGISGQQLAREAYDQAWVFGARFAFMQTVLGIEQDDDGLLVSMSDAPSVRASAVLLATGARYRRIDIPALEDLVGAGVYYGGPTAEAPGLTGRDVFVVGGANSAGQAVLHLARFARRVHLVVRGASLRAAMSEYLVSQIESTDNIEVHLRTEVVGGGGLGVLDHLVLNDRDGTTPPRTVAADALFLLIGAEPHTDWLPSSIARDPGGFVLTGSDLPQGSWALDRDPFPFETSVPGVLAGGDVRHGSVKRVASAVGEGSIAVQLVHQLFAADGRTPRGRPAHVGS